MGEELLALLLRDLMTRAEAMENRWKMYEEGRFTGLANALDSNSPHCAKTLEEAVKWHGEAVAYVAAWQERERCAKVAEDLWSAEPQVIADAIRAALPPSPQGVTE